MEKAERKACFALTAASRQPGVSRVEAAGPAEEHLCDLLELVHLRVRKVKAVSQPLWQWKHTRQRRCLSRRGSGNTQGKGSVLAAEAVETHEAKAVS